jgi:hypothetical protein
MHTAALSSSFDPGLSELLHYSMIKFLPDPVKHVFVDCITSASGICPIPHSKQTWLLYNLINFNLI